MFNRLQIAQNEKICVVQTNQFEQRFNFDFGHYIVDVHILEK